MNIEKLYQLYLSHPRVCTDSRNIINDSLFFALKGANFDGNLYAEEALKKGAAIAVIDNPEYKKGGRFFLVPDVLKALQDLAYYHRKLMNIPVLGITGTNGKTTTKELLTKVVSEKYNVLSTKGNLNNHIGVPLTLLELNKDHQWAIIEMGASKPGDIDELCGIADPDMAIITNIGRAHLEGFGSPEGVVKTKTELYRHVIKKNGIIFYNSNDSLLEEQIKKINYKNVLSYGAHANDFCQGRVISADPFVHVGIREKEGEYIIKSDLVGSYNANNLMASVCLGKYLGIPKEKIVSAIESYHPVNNRSQLTQTRWNTIMVDCYNANPTSMKAAIESFIMIPANQKKRILILGDMLELGQYSDEEHRMIIKAVSGIHNAEIFLVGPIFEKNKNVSEYVKFYRSSEDLRSEIEKNKIQNALILLKGSRGIHLEKLLDLL